MEARDGCTAAELGVDLQAGKLLRHRGGGGVQQFTARLADLLDGLRRNVKDPAVGVGPVHDVQRALAARGLGRCPQRCLAGRLGAVDADYDGAQFRAARGAFHGSSSKSRQGSGSHAGTADSRSKRAAQVPERDQRSRFMQERGARMCGGRSDRSRLRTIRPSSSRRGR